MGFQLVIAEGKEAGREFVFEQASVLIGRTSECDVVLYDPGVSRQHCRIFSEGPDWFIEDMGSSNGTKVNGTLVKKKTLADGDAVSLGPVTFSFSGRELAPQESTNPGDEPPVEQHTRIVSAADVQQRSRNRGVALVPEGVGEPQLKELTRSQTQTLQAVTRPRPSTGGAKAVKRDGGSSSALARPREPLPPPVAADPGSTGELAPTERPSAAAAPARRPSSQGRGAVARANSNREAPALSAAERARIKRQSSGPIALAKVFWAEASGTKKLGAMLGLLLVVAGGGAGIWVSLFAGPEVAPPPPEPSALTPNSAPIAESFGLGEGVTYERADQKIFDFEYRTPTQAVVVLHYQAKDISSHEVAVSVNGSDVGEVPADTLNVNDRVVELLIPSAALKKNAANRIVFDNTRNPPASDPWRVWNLSVEVTVLPDVSVGELKSLAVEAFKRGLVYFERKDVGAENRYRAWREFRTAWLFLESYPEPRPEQYALARERMRDAQQELDRQCSKLLLEARTDYNQRRYDAARVVLEGVVAYFPAKDQICPARADQMRDEFGI